MKNKYLKYTLNICLILAGLAMLFSLYRSMPVCEAECRANVLSESGSYVSDSPLTYYLGHAWLSLLGDHIFSLRILTCLIYLLSIAAACIYFYVRTGESLEASVLFCLLCPASQMWGEPIFGPSVCSTLPFTLALIAILELRRSHRRVWAGVLAACIILMIGCGASTDHFTTPSPLLKAATTVTEGCISFYAFMCVYFLMHTRKHRIIAWILAAVGSYIYITAVQSCLEGRLLPGALIPTFCGVLLCPVILQIRQGKRLSLPSPNVLTGMFALIACILYGDTAIIISLLPIAFALAYKLIPRHLLYCAIILAILASCACLRANIEDRNHCTIDFGVFSPKLDGAKGNQWAYSGLLRIAEEAEAGDSLIYTKKYIQQ